MKIVKLLKELYLEGGIEVLTPGTARTLIQPDADFISWIKPDTILDSPDYQMHLKAVRKETQRLKRLRIGKKTGKYLAYTLSVITSVYLLK